MEKHEALELAEQASLINPNWCLIDGAFVVNQYDIQDQICELVRLVEQATLERAAKVCEEYGGIISGNECAESVRALKDSHD